MSRRGIHIFNHEVGIEEDKVEPHIIYKQVIE
jgi:hypothetical protein